MTSLQLLQALSSHVLVKDRIIFFQSSPLVGGPDMIRVSNKFTGKSVKLTNFKGSFLAAVDELASVQTLGGDEQLLTCLELVRVTEVDHRERCTTTGVMDDVLQKKNDT